MGSGGGASGSQLASSIVGGWPRLMGHRLAIYFGGPRGSSAEGQGDGAWFDSGYMVCVSAWVLVPYCIFYVKGNRDPEVVSVLLPWCVGLRVTLLEKCAQSTLHLLSEDIIWQFLFTVWVYSSWRNAWVVQGVGLVSFIVLFLMFIVV